MKLLFRFIVYAAIIVGLTVGSIALFREHPEVQLAFLIPGLFFLVFSKVMDDVYRKSGMRFRIAKGK